MDEAQVTHIDAVEMQSTAGQPSVHQGQFRGLSAGLERDLVYICLKAGDRRYCQ